jgi:peptidoglycan/xylan/chitin deacetylase (PgdA/CDA1 family)
MFYEKMHPYIGVMMTNKIIVKGNPNISNIALTFDDGPSKVTPYILDVLLKYGAKATFFCLGSCIENNNVSQDHKGKYISGFEIVKRADEEGHLIAVHSYNHLVLPTLTDEEILNNELSRTKDIITNLIRKNPAYFRPPYGTINDRVNNLATKIGLKTIYWNCGSADCSTKPIAIHDGPIIYTYGPEDIYNKIMKNTVNGSIILCHDGYNGIHDANFGIVLALDRIIPELQQKGFNFVTIDDLLANGNYTSENCFTLKLFRALNFFRYVIYLNFFSVVHLLMLEMIGRPALYAWCSEAFNVIRSLRCLLLLTFDY